MSVPRSLVSSALAGLLLVFGLGGCAGMVPAARPADYPLHLASPPFDVHWRLAVEPGAARADGLIERRTEAVWVARVQLVGRDGAGRIVSFSQPSTIRWASAWDAEPFELALTPRGGEEGYEMRVQSFEYKNNLNSR